jgi:tetratricopeptide (TPR) repeat protein
LTKYFNPFLILTTMKKFIYPSIILALVVTLGFVYKKYQTQKNQPPGIKERAVSVNASSEWLNTKQAIEGLLDKIRRNPEDIKAKLQLAMAYIQESRVTGDHAYYDDASLKLLNEVLEKDPKNFDALCGKTTVLLSQHHFTEGLASAQNLVGQYPSAAFGYGLLVDAHVELGNYDQAIIFADKLMAIRPDLRSYSRVSYLREIHGDYEGAKEAMLMAVKSGSIGLEQTEWCRVQLGKLYEATGDLENATKHYQMAAAARENYPFAQAGLARIARKKGKNTEGVALLENANKNIIEPSFYEDLSDAYFVQNQRAKANKAANKLIEMLGGNHSDTTNHALDKAIPEHGHYADKELAEAYLKIDDLEHALLHANLEYARRPNNIDINEVMAWVQYKSGAFDKAIPFIEKALKTGSQKPELLWKAGQIFLKNNQEKRGNELIKKALSINKNLEINLI